jgi:hypothetical protein
MSVADNKRIRELWRQGASRQEIFERTNIPYEKICKALLHLPQRIDRKNGPRPEAQQLQAVTKLLMDIQDRLDDISQLLRKALKIPEDVIELRWQELAAQQPAERDESDQNPNQLPSANRSKRQGSGLPEYEL